MLQRNLEGDVDDCDNRISFSSISRNWGKDIQLLYATSMGGVLAMSHPWKSVQGRHGVAVKNCRCVDKMWTVAAANRNSSWW